MALRQGGRNGAPLRRLLLWLVKPLNIYEAGHPQGPLTCSKYGHHRHLPLDLIQWF